MTDFIDNLLTSMSSKFNESKELVAINLNDDKTLKWRGLHNNQYASAKKRKDGKRAAATATNLSSSNVDDPPLNNDSSSTSTSNSTTATTTSTSVTTAQSNCSDSTTTATNSVNVSAVNDEANNIVNDLNSSEDKNIHVNSADKDNNNKMNSEKDSNASSSTNEKQNEVRPVRRTLRRKHNDDVNEEIQNVSVQNRKIGRPKRQLSASSGASNTDTVHTTTMSPKPEEKSNATPNPVITEVKMTRRRARTIQNENVNETIQSNEPKAQEVGTQSSVPNASKSKTVDRVTAVLDQNITAETPSPPKLRRSERTHHAFISTDHKDVGSTASHNVTPATPSANSSTENDTKLETKTENNALNFAVAAKQEENQKISDNESLKKFRKKPVDEKKVSENSAENNKMGENVPNGESIQIEATKPISDKPHPSPMETVGEEKQNFEDLITPNEIKKSDIIENTEIEEANLDATQPRKRGRKPGGKPKTRNDLNVTIGTRSSPAKKSPRFSSDESPFTYTLPKKDKTIAEQALPQQRLSRRIKPTPKILANEELRQGFELQNNARLSLSSEHLDNENDRSPKQDIQNLSETFAKEITPPRTENAENKTPPSTGNVKEPSPSTSTSATVDYMRPVPRRCPDPEEFLNEIKMAKINLHRSPEDNKKLNLKQKKRLSKLKEKHLQKLGLQKTSKANSKDSTSDSNAETDDNEEFVPTKKVNVGRPSIKLRVRGQKDIVIYDKHITGSKQAKDKQKRSSTQSLSNFTSITDKSEANANRITRSRENSLILSTKHKIGIIQNNVLNGTMLMPPNESTNGCVEQERNICLCSKPSRYYTRRIDETFCAAIDQIETEQVGCSNEIDGELLNLLRPSVRVSYMILCDNHKRRLQAHNCCAGCGIFCTQGRFILCSQNHFFHRECATKFIVTAPFDPHRPNFTPMLVLKCPHCGIDAPQNESYITMRCGSTPVFTPSRKKVPRPAKMSIGSHSYRALRTREETLLIDIEKLIPEQVTAILVQAQNRFPFTQTSNVTNKDVFCAITQNDIDRMAEIIASGFDITTPIKDFHEGTCLHLASNFGSTKMIYLILSRVSTIDFLNMTDKEHRTAAMCSILGGKNEILRILIQCGADITQKGPDGMTALHLAAKTGNLEAAEIMLNSYRKCASVYSLEKFLNTCDDGGWTALVWAAELGNAELVSALLNCGANVNICDSENNTALHWAVLSDDVNTVLLLLQNGCNLGTQNINGDTPLHIACRNENTRISLFLLAHGANLDITNNSNEAPHDCISDENSPCGRAIFFNLQIRNIAGFIEQNIICQDISNGRELYPIQIVGRKKYRSNNKNGMSQSEFEFNDSNIPDFKYITKTILLQNSIQIDRRISQMRICSCLDNCTTQSCQCSEISIQNWYNSEGRLNSDFNFADPAMIFECNDVCGCNKLLCKNRIVQNGSKVPLQIFECDEKVKGLGVKALIKIPRGTFVAEYTGEILTDLEADRRTDDSYFFDLGASEHCIDANFYGNVSRFFNHSCEPNIVPIRVYFEHQDLRFPKIAFFASRDIEAGEEITFDYGEKFWVFKYKLFTCHCGTTSCRFSDKTIAKTLDEYNQRKENNF